MIHINAFWLLFCLCWFVLFYFVCEQQLPNIDFIVSVGFVCEHNLNIVGLLSTSVGAISFIVLLMFVFFCRERNLQTRLFFFIVFVNTINTLLVLLLLLILFVWIIKQQLVLLFSFECCLWTSLQHALLFDELVKLNEHVLLLSVLCCERHLTPIACIDVFCFLYRSHNRVLLFVFIMSRNNQKEW